MRPSDVGNIEDQASSTSGDEGRESTGCFLRVFGLNGTTKMSDESFQGTCMTATYWLSTDRDLQLLLLPREILHNRWQPLEGPVQQ